MGLGPVRFHPARLHVHLQRGEGLRVLSADPSHNSVQDRQIEFLRYALYYK